MQGVDLAEALHAGRRVYGTCVTVAAPGWPELIASTGVDFVFIDTEHIPLDRRDVTALCRSFRALGIAPIVRVPMPDPYWACMALDAGAAGVVFPYVETVEQAQALRGAVKLRPLKGAVLHDVLSDLSILPTETADYLSERNRGSLMILNIESQAAIDGLDDLLAVPGVDVLLVGPHDLSINLGIPERYSDTLFQNAIETIIGKARARNVGVGIHWSEAMEQHIAWAQAGANFIVHSSDQTLVRKALGGDLARFKEAMGDGPSATQDGETVI